MKSLYSNRRSLYLINKRNNPNHHILFSSFQQKGFTLIELIVVVIIVGLLMSMAADSFQKMNKQNRYETFIHKIQHLVQDARNRSIINAAEYNGGIYEEDTGYGLEIEKTNDYTVQLRLFQDKDENGTYESASDEIIEEFEESEVVRVVDFSGVLRESSTTVNNFDKVTISFQAGAESISQIINETPQSLRSIELKFYHPRLNGAEGLRKKFSFDTISKISEINNYPILIDAEKTGDRELTLIANETLTNLTITDTTTFSIKNDADTTYTVSSGIVSGKNIILTTSGTAPVLSGTLNIISSSNSQITTPNTLILPENNSIPLQPRNLELKID